MATTDAAIEPRFARVAAAIGDPTRARMLSVLCSGRRTQEIVEQVLRAGGT
jgi:DNA-binding transcriptional ArsR family regulator